MAYVHVYLMYGEQSSLVLLDRNCCYGKLLDMVVIEFGLDPTRSAVTMKYRLKNDLPPVRIRSDSNVLSYITLKGMDRDPSKYPINVEVTNLEFGHQCISFPSIQSESDNVQSEKEIFSLQEIASDICEAIVKPLGHSNEHEVTIVSNPDARNVEEGKVFRNKEVLKLSLCFYAIQNMFEFLVVRSDKGEYLIKCSHDECSWKCRSSKMGKIDLFKIRKISIGHTCAANIVLGLHRQVTTFVVSSFIKYKYTSSRTIYTPNDICNDILHTYGVSLNYVKAWRSREKTLKLVRGDPKDSYQQLPSYFHMLERTNPRTVTGTYHGICAYHLLQNLKSYYEKSGHNITQAFNAAVRAYTSTEYEYNIQQLDKINVKIRGYLNEVGPERWSRYHMQANRYFTMMSNIVESVNEVTKATKNYSIVALLDSLRETVQSWCYKNRDLANSTFTKLSTKYERLIREMSTELKNMRVSPTNRTIFTVSNDGSTFVVNIEKRMCTCRMLQVDQIPCPHTLAVLSTTIGDLYEYCSYFYTREAYVNAYNEFVYPVGNQNEWTMTKEIESVVVLPPDQKRSSGRPAEQRKRSSGERKQTLKCGQCQGAGHNRRTCTKLIPLSKDCDSGK